MTKRAASSGPRPVPPTDQELINRIYEHVNQTANSWKTDRSGSIYIETAGGVHSPTLAGNSQLEAFRPLRLPTILIGSPLLGGISSTISAYESLKIHGFDIDMLLVLKEEYYENYKYFERWSLEHGIKFAAIDSPPEFIQNDSTKEFTQMLKFYETLTHSESSIANAVRTLQALHLRRIEDLESMPQRALKHIWWPFLQHKLLVNPRQVNVIDSAYKDSMLTYQASSPSPSTSISTNEAHKEHVDADPLLRYKFDGSASWWTQSLGHSHPKLALSVAHAAGRYGHVIFPGCIHEPALNLSEHLLGTVGKGWANRVFFSDNGSTGIEVALKMALTSFKHMYKLPRDVHFELGVVGLKGSYHGDTIGAMDASEPSVYNKQVDWYKGKGAWLDAPQVRIVEGGQTIIFTNPGDQWGETGWKVPYSGLQEIYNIETRLNHDPLTQIYTDHIFNFLRKFRFKSSIIPAALILEPVVMGAGGMLFVDPLFQAVLIRVVRKNSSLFGIFKSELPKLPSDDEIPVESYQETNWSGLPVVFDEVFSGLYRLGRPSAATFLGKEVSPDIAVYSKILSAGTVPLSVTMAREEVFDAFLGEGPVNALLHGHSYTAHPIGCSVAHTGLKLYQEMDSRGDWNTAKQNWKSEIGVSNEAAVPWSFWSQSFVHQLAQVPDVEGVMSLGTVLAIYLKDQSNTKGYTSSAARFFLDQLQSRQLYGQDQIPCEIHARPLGNVAYFITSLNTPLETVEAIQSTILKTLAPN